MAGALVVGGLDMPLNSSLPRTSTKSAGIGSCVLKSDSGTDLFVLHTHPDNKHLLINGHGESIAGFHYKQRLTALERDYGLNPLFVE